MEEVDTDFIMLNPSWGWPSRILDAPTLERVPSLSVPIRHHLDCGAAVVEQNTLG